MNKLILILLSFVLFASCGKDKKGDDFSKPAAGDTSASDPSSYDPNRGEGKFDKIDLSPNLDHALANAGEKISGVKCLSCHKLTEERLVGPGWKDVTLRRTPEWLMNFVTNPDPMIDKDPELQAQLELCLVRMPNQSIGDQEAREILEYMRKNDGVK